MGSFDLEGRGGSVEEKGGEKWGVFRGAAALFGEFIMGEELIHPFEPLFFRFGHVDLKEISRLFGKIEEEAAGAL